MPHSELERWYIDTWDSASGRAFVSRRLANLYAEAQEGDRPNAPVVFIAPPDFGPRPVANRSLGFSAARAAFQVGFVIGKKEVGFRTIDEVVTLVRRVYGASGMNPPEGEPGPKQPPDEGPGPEERKSKSDRLMSLEFRRFAELAQHQAGEEGDSEAFNWFAADGSWVRFSDTREIFEWLANRMFADAKRRSNNQEEAEIATSNLLCLFGLLIHPRDLYRICSSSMRLRSFAYWYFEDWRNSRATFRPAFWISGRRPYEVLDALPLLPSINGGSTLLDFLGRATAGVRDIHGNYAGRHPIERALLLAIATFVQTMSEESRSGSGSWPYDYRRSEVARRAQRGWRWLTQQLPERVFSPAVESAITDSARPREATASA